MSQAVRVLILEDSALDVESTSAQIRRAGFTAELDRVVSEAEFETALNSNQAYDLILADYALPEFDGLSALKIAKRRAPLTPFIFVSGTLGEDITVESLQNGATDYVSKHRLERLAPAIKRALAERVERQLRLESERELAASEMRFRELADALPQLVWTTNEGGEVTYANHQALEYGGEGAVRHAPAGLQIAHIEDRPKVEERWRHAASDGQGFAMECRLRRSRDGAFRWHLVRFVALESQGQRTGAWLATAVDVEEQKQREHALRESKEALRRANETLEQRVQERTEAYRRLSGRLLLIQDVERKKVARELHETLGQYLTGLKINLDIIQSGADRIDAERRSDLLAQSVQILDRCIREARTTSYLLHPPILDEAGFAHAAQWYVDGFSERSGIAASLVIPPDFQRLPNEVEIVLFRVLQESLTNVHHHSGTAAVDISVGVEDGEVNLEVSDYGCGIPEARLRLFSQGLSDQGLGLNGMRERVRELRGWLKIDSDGTGTKLSVGIPLSSQESVSAA
ncbi:MAG: response regulator [Acidobacteriales bacterium]|nr:response regulator [Terriglobales bacterium]